MMSSIVYVAFAITVGVLLVLAVWDNHQNPPGGFA